MGKEVPVIMASARPKRARAPPRKLDIEADDTDIRRAIALSLKHQKRTEASIPEAPVYYPTAEEFQDPLGYISKITPEAERYGICKIVPPEGSKPRTSYPKESGLAFPTKRQKVQNLQEGKPFGSGFDHDPECKWNMNTLHQKPQSLLKEIQCEIQGVTKPWVYLGSLFTSFCWHTEDHYLYSLNYMHNGHGKTWYGVPSSNKEKFDLAMKSFMPQRFRKNPELLYQLITLLNPFYCQDEGVRVYHTVQKAEEFVVTFPNAYHGGFSHGLNCAEAVNFALPEWLPWGAKAMQDYHEKMTRKGGKRPDVFAHAQLLYHLGAMLFKIVLRNRDKIASKQSDPKLLNSCIKEVVCDELPFDPKAFVPRLLQDFSKSAKHELHYRKWLEGVKMTS